MSENTIAITRTPEIIAVEIRAYTQQFNELALSYAIKIGQKLCEAKALVDHGQWGTWIKDNTEFSQSTANNLMKIFEEYGADQVSLLGDANSQTLGNMSYTKALKLIAIPAEEREEFIEENNVDGLSTRELDRLIKEREAAKKAQTDAEAREQQTKAALEEEKKKAEEAAAEAKRLQEELQQLQAAPIDVDVITAEPDTLAKAREEAAAEAKKQAEADLQKQINKAEKKAADAVKKAEDAQKKLDQLQADGDAMIAQATAEADKARDEAVKKAEALEKKLAVADTGTAQFKVLFDEVQALLNKMISLVDTAAPEKQDGLRKALSAMFDAYGAKIKEPAA